LCVGGGLVPVGVCGGGLKDFRAGRRGGGGGGGGEVLVLIIHDRLVQFLLLV